MSKINRIKLVIIMMLASVLMFTASAFLMNSVNPLTTKAEEEKVFVMSDTIEARMSTPAGLRFTVYLNGATKKAVEDAVKDDGEFGFIIAPAVNFDHATSKEYLEDGVMVDKAVVPVSADKLTQVGEEDSYFVNAVLYNIKEENWDLDFAAVAYYKTGDKVTYTTNETLPRANIGEIVAAEFFNAEGNSETRGQLYEMFNYGNDQPKEVHSDVVGTYTIPAHAIPVKNSNIVFALTLPDNAYFYKLTEDVVINNQNIQQGENIVPAFDTELLKTFDGVIDGQGYVFNINIHTNNRPTTGVFCKTLNGTLKNVNFVVRADTWCSGNTEYGSFIYTLNGTIDSCIFTIHPTRYGPTNWTLHWAMINNTTANAVVRNSIFDNRADMAEKFVYNQEAGGTFQNVLIVNDKAWTEASLASVQTTGIINGLYLFQGVDALVTGQVAYAFDGSAIVADNRVLNIKETLGYDVSLANIAVRAGNGDKVDDKFSDSEEIIRYPSFVKEELKANVSVSLAQSTLELFEKGATGSLNAIVTMKGVAVDASLLTWVTNDVEVATVANGVVTPVGIGTATVTVSYYGVSASCVVTVKEYYVVVTNAADFITNVRANNKIKLGADIAVNNQNASTDANSNFSSCITQIGGNTTSYNAVLDGQGYTLTISVGSTARPNGVLFATLNGTIKNTNVIIRADGWASGTEQHLGTMVGVLNGTIENCTLVTWNSKFGDNNTLAYSPIQKATATAVVRNFVVYNYGPINTGSLIKTIEAEDKNATIENVAIINNTASTSKHTATVALSNNMSDVYFFDSLADLMAGKASWEYDGSAFVAASKKVDMEELLGFELALVKRGVLYIAQNGGSYCDDQLLTIAVPTIVKEELKANVSIEMVETTLELDEKSPATPVTAIATMNGVNVDSALIAWSSSDEDVVIVSNGVITVTGMGTATVYATYYGVSATCEVTVEEFWYKVGTAEDFIAIVKANSNAKIKLTADIEIFNDKVTDLAMSNVSKYVANEFNGIIDGQGHSISLVFAENGRLTTMGGFLFTTLNGTIKDTTFNVASNYWGDGSARVYGLIGTLNGTFENNIVNFLGRRYGQSHNYHWSTFSVTTADAVIKNVVIFDGNADMKYIVSNNVAAGTTIENLLLFHNNSWSEGARTTTIPEQLSKTANIKNVYLYHNEGQVASASSYVYDPATATVIANTGSALNYDRVLGFGLTKVATQVYKFAANGTVAALTDDTILAFTHSSVVLDSFVLATDATTFFNAVKAGSNVKLGEDIVLNSSGINENALSFGSTVLSTFGGILDGQGHTLTINVNTAARPNGVLFNTLNGVVRNVNIVVRANNWASSNYESNGTVFGVVNGTIDNCIITAVHSLYGTVERYGTAPIGRIAANALIRNTVVVAGTGMKTPLAHNIEEGALIKNVALINNAAWDSTSITYLTNKLVCDVDGLYLFDSIDAVVAGTVGYEFVDSAFVESKQFVDFNVASATVTVRAGALQSNPLVDTEEQVNTVDFKD